MSSSSSSGSRWSPPRDSLANALPRIVSLAITFGPFLLPRALAFIRSVRASSNPSGIRPLPARTARALNLLFLSALVALLSTLPPFTPENIFMATRSRLLQTPTPVLFARLAALRPLTAADAALRAKLLSQEARLAYAAYGPAVLAACPFCDAGSPRSYLLYALPRALAPHLLHLLALGLATSAPLAGPAAARWRPHAAVAALALAAAELYLLGAHDAAAARAGDATAGFLFWRLRLLRGVGVAGADALLGWAVWLAGTGRAFAQPAPLAERLEAQARVLEGVLAKVRALGALRNAVYRDRGLRERHQGYWVRNETASAALREEREVLEAQRSVLGREGFRGSVDRQAAEWADGVLAGLRGLRAQGTVEEEQ